jgi:hypothetical protein
MTDEEINNAERIWRCERAAMEADLKARCDEARAKAIEHMYSAFLRAYVDYTSAQLMAIAATLRK